MMYEVFGRVPGTRNPGWISIDEFEDLKQACDLNGVALTV